MVVLDLCAALDRYLWCLFVCTAGWNQSLLNGIPTRVRVLVHASYPTIYNLPFFFIDLSIWLSATACFRGWMFLFVSNDCASTEAQRHVTISPEAGQERKGKVKES